MDSIDEFRHEALNPAVPSIRVVRILPGVADDIVRCSLRETALGKAHTCLSWVWGSPEADRKTILINDKRFSVLPNLWSFLHQGRELELQEWMWIDAISIDQNNIPERNQQVRQMSNIYRQAKHVIIWPGPIQWRTASISFEEAKR